jgi:hypothetical protein
MFLVSRETLKCFAKLGSLYQLLFEQFIEPIQAHSILPGVRMIFDVQVDFDAIGKPLDALFFLRNALIQLTESESQTVQLWTAKVYAFFELIDLLQHPTTPVLETYKSA